MANCSWGPTWMVTVSGVSGESEDQRCERGDGGTLEFWRSVAVNLGTGLRVWEM